MNRCLVGSGVGSSGEGVCALSSSLLANFLPSDEPTLSRFSSAVHPVLKEISTFHRPVRNSFDATNLQAVGSSDG
jgi:exopolyphosphatase/pppGpp-phosphohydrolase